MQDGWPCSFQSTLPAGGERHGSDAKRYKAIGFQSTLPVGGATNATKQHLLTEQFQSTLPVGGATPSSLLCFVLYHISIHAPREGSDLPIWVNRRFLIKFQSTLPVGGATITQQTVAALTKDFNPRSPWGERLKHVRRPACRQYFNPRSPWGERPHLQATSEDASYFNPRSPWGERHRPSYVPIHVHVFQSTLPAGEATLNAGMALAYLSQFQSTLPAGGATPRR